MNSHIAYRWILAASTLLLIAQQTVGFGDESTKTLKVLSYNVQFLPGPASLFNQRGNDDYRPKRLSEVLAEYDIIGFNEVFELKPRKTILEGLKAAWKDRYHVAECPEPPKETRKYNAGLAIASKYPIVETNSIAYSSWSTIKEFGVFADEFAAKGALHARIQLGGSPPLEVDVFTTHLDSKLGRVRAQQILELAEFAKKHTSPDRAILFLGDFNTRGNPKYQADPESEYAHLMKQLTSVRANLKDLWIKLGEGEGGTSEPTDIPGSTRIDYVFFAPAEGSTNRLEPKSVAVQPFLDSKTVSLSDHSAVEALFKLR